ncbi:hypothetical protein POVWA2_003150 [Plasmodium ovale wallikeri]|uniref:Uncharacterized protein n=1 Tax=Plasmodium ovale wallikeri TaxID=864142 RepID=A0A1A8YI68_PLAOA|nr:hypothetical protein POVWA1_002970 [Plasmodium ovale wallikeri]SBT31246.1 hypothetical protein POVWA2_003150 [Plasmodium ovale wallikeri]
MSICMHAHMYAHIKNREKKYRVTAKRSGKQELQTGAANRSCKQERQTGAASAAGSEMNAKRKRTAAGKSEEGGERLHMFVGRSAP